MFSGKDEMFHTASNEAIKSGKITDVYFERGVQILKSKGIDKWVKGEVRASVLPSNWNWAVVAGVEEVANLFEDLPVNISCMPEGTIFEKEYPVLVLEGKYTDFAVYETPLLGLLCQASGIATKAARCKLAAGERGVYSFGARRMHPAIAPMIERNAFIGGCDGVAVTESARLIGESPVGTMAHALILTIGTEEETFRAFHEVIDPKVRRVALVDTYNDEKFASLKAAETLGKDLFAVRLDTPKSRRGDFLKVLEEVRWELDLRGYDYVKIFLSGGIDENQILEYNHFADAYGVGTAISNAPVVDFSFDLVEVEGKPLAKRGKLSGSKQVYRCKSCYTSRFLPEGKDPGECKCGGSMEVLLQPLISSGKLKKSPPKPQAIRAYVLEQLSYYSL